MLLDMAEAEADEPAAAAWHGLAPHAMDNIRASFGDMTATELLGFISHIISDAVLAITAGMRDAETRDEGGAAADDPDETANQS